MMNLRIGQETVLESKIGVFSKKQLTLPHFTHYR